MGARLRLHAEDPLVFTIRFEDGLADGLAYRIWEKIEVTNQHRSSDYHGTGGLLICVTNLKYWVDPGDGYVQQLDRAAAGLSPARRRGVRRPPSLFPVRAAGPSSRRPGPGRAGREELDGSAAGTRDLEV